MKKCKVVSCSQPVVSLRADKSEPAVQTGGKEKEPFLISYSSIYSEYCYFHKKIKDRLIEGSLLEK